MAVAVAVVVLPLIKAQVDGAVAVAVVQGITQVLAVTDHTQDRRGR